MIENTTFAEISKCRYCNSDSPILVESSFICSGGVKVQCQNCGACGPEFDAQDTLEAILHWNASLIKHLEKGMEISRDPDTGRDCVHILYDYSMEHVNYDMLFQWLKNRAYK